MVYTKEEIQQLCDLQKKIIDSIEFSNRMMSELNTLSLEYVRKIDNIINKQWEEESSEKKEELKD